MSVDEIRARDNERVEFRQEQAVKKVERGEFYHENEDFDKALDNFKDALALYNDYLDAFADHFDISIVLRSGTVADKNIVYSKILLNLQGILWRISACYEPGLKRAYIVSKLVAIYDKLSEYESGFDRDQLETYRSLSKKLSPELRDEVSQYQSQFESLPAIKEETDEVFKSIRSSLSKISSSAACSLSFESSEGCFIATAAYGTTNHPDLDTFRAFRDRTLMTSFLGRGTVKLYYRFGPFWASQVKKLPPVQKLIRHILTHLAQWLRQN